MYIYIAYIACVLILLVLGITVIVADRKSPINRSFLTLTITSIYWILMLFLGYYFEATPEVSIVFIRLANSAGILAGLVLSVFFYLFPKKTFKISKVISVVVFVLAGIIFSISAFTPLVEKSIIIENGIIIHEELGPFMGVFTISSAALILGAVIFSIIKLKDLQGIERKKMKISAVGLFTFVIIAVITNLVLPIFGNNDFARVSVLSTLIFTIPVFYSLQKHRFIDASNFALGLLQKIVLIGLYLFVATGAFSLMVTIIPGANFYILVPISAFIALMILQRIEKVFPQFYTSSFKALTDGLAELKAKLVYGEDYTQFMNLLENFFIIKMNIKNVRIFAIRSSEEKLAVPVYIKDKLTEELEKNRDDLLVYEEIKFKRLEEDTKNIIMEKMKAIDSCLAIPLFSESNLIGIFSIGFKAKDEGFSREEINEILKIKHILEVGFMNILLKKNLQEENNFMKSVIEEKTKKLKEQFKQIKELLNQKSDFIAVTAHEFRTPLSIALFQLQNMMETYEKTPDIENDLATVEKALEDLKTLTQKLFDVQKYDLNKVDLVLEPVGIKKYVSEIYQGFKTTADDKGIELTLNDMIKEEIEMQLDQSQMRQVFHNLLNNAAKFVPAKGGKIRIELSDNEENITIKIIDNGNGVSDEEKGQIFEKFKSKKNSAAAGIGLGLYLCFKITELHKGKINVEDAPGGGASFVINLPK